MKQKKAIGFIEAKLQVLLLEYIQCLEDYCSLLRTTHASFSAKQLDQFISIAVTLRTLLETMHTTAVHSLLPEKKSTRNQIQSDDQLAEHQ